MSLIFLLALASCGRAAWAAGPETGGRVVVFAPQISHYAEGSDYYGLLEADAEKRWPRGWVELRRFPPEALLKPASVVKALEDLAGEENLRAVILSESPDGSVEGVARLRAKRPELYVVSMDPYEELDRMAQAATLTVLLNHQARAFYYTVMAYRMGARSLVFLSLPRLQKVPSLARQHRILSQTTRDLGMILISELEGPDLVVDPVGLAEVEAYLEETVDRYLERYGPETAFLSTSTLYHDLLTPIVMRKGGCLLESIQPSLLMGFPEALDQVDEARSLVGQWRRLLALQDEKIMELNPPAQFAVWTYPYPHTVMLALVEVVVAALEKSEDLYDLDHLSRALEKHAPGGKWLLSAHTDYITDSLVPQTIEVLEDTYWFGQGYQGFPRLQIPPQYYRIR